MSPNSAPSLNQDQENKMSEVVKTDQVQVVPINQNQNQFDAVSAILHEVAVNPDIDVSKLAQVWEMQKDILNQKAKLEFKKAFTAAQSEIQPIYKSASNDQTKSKYATLEIVSNTIKPAILKHGLSTSFGTADAQREGFFRVTCKLSHIGGFDRDEFLDVPMDGAGIKGTANKTPMHALGSSVSYARRYLLMMIFDLATTDDNDGNRASNPQIVTPQQAVSLRAALDDIEQDIPLFLNAYGAGSIDNFPSQKFNEAMRKLENKKAQLAAKGDSNG